MLGCWVVDVEISKLGWSVWSNMKRKKKKEEEKKTGKKALLLMMINERKLMMKMKLVVDGDYVRQGSW